MTDLKILFVEDAKTDISAFNDTVNRYNHEKKRSISSINVTSVDEAFTMLDKTFDGAIIDLKLDKKGDEGNEVVKKIDLNFRIPIVIMTATPSNALAGILYLGNYTKGETSYEVILDKLCKVYDTGVTRIMGGRGIIEEVMNRVFRNTIFTNIIDWQQYIDKGMSTEGAILRFTISNLVELLDNDFDKYFPEEMYITPADVKVIKTGFLVKKKSDDHFFIILSPSCDLAIHEGKMKTDRVLLCAVENPDILLLENLKPHIEKIKHNSYSGYYHFLPKTRLYLGGLINFRKVETYEPDDYINIFDIPIFQISMPFCKEIVSRFSSYYARQGQPDFDPTCV
jgi:hypothetical protein